MKGSNRPSGFTLLEVMVVVVILGILAALVVPKIISRPDEARVIAAKQDLASLMQALKLYRLDNQRYPTTEQGLQALTAPPTTAPLPPNWKAGGYVERLPRDPWGNPYQYLNPGVHGEIDIFSFPGARNISTGELLLFSDPNKDKQGRCKGHRAGGQQEPEAGHALPEQ